MSQLHQTLRHEKQRLRWERRIQMVRKFSEGYMLSEFEDAISDHYKIAKKALRRDWDRRKKWMPILAQLQDPEFKISTILLRVQHIAEAAWETYRMAKTANNHNAMVGALNQLMSVTVRETELLQSLGLLTREPLKIKVEQRSVEIKALLKEYRVIIEAAAISQSNTPVSKDNTGKQIHTA